MRNIYSLFLSVCISVVFFAAYISTSFKLYAAHQTRGDLTAYAQGMWNTVHGHFMASTYNYSVHNYYDKQFREITPENSNILGIHFNPVLLLFIPLYALFPDPMTLLTIQAALAVAGGWVIYVLANRMLKNEILAFTIQLAYLTYFATVSAVLNQFHAYTLALFFGPLLLLASQSKRRWFYWLSLGLFLLVQENISLVTTFYGFYLMLSPKTRRRGLVTSTISIIYFILTIYHLIPALSPYHFYLFSGIYGSPLGNNIQEIALGAIRHPLLLIESIFNQINLRYIGNLLLGIMPFAMFAPGILLVGFSSLAQNILSSSLGLKTQQMHYESGSVAFLFYALILGLAFVLTKTAIGKVKHISLICAFIVLTMTGISYKKFTSFRLNPSMINIQIYTERNAEMDQLITLIPETASVSTQDYLSAHLSGRPGLYQFPVYAEKVDYLLLAKDDAVWPLTIVEQNDWLSKIRASNKYALVRETNHFVLFSQSAHPSQ